MCKRKWKSKFQLRKRRNKMKPSRKQEDKMLKVKKARKNKQKNKVRKTRLRRQ